MLPELAIFPVLLTSAGYKQYYPLISVDKYGMRELAVVYKTLPKFFEKYPDKDATIDDFSVYFFSTYPRLKKDELDAYQAIFAQIKTSSVSNDGVSDVLLQIKRRQTATALAESAIKFTEGLANKEDISALIEDWSALQADDSLESEVSFVTDDLDEILAQTYLKPGLRWRLDSLNRSLGSLRTGDFGFLFARPETGKTTFLASEITFMAAQSDKPVLWFNNEEQGSKVKARCYQAALGCHYDYLIANPKRCQEDYLNVTKGNIKLHDSGTLFRGEVERVIERVDPGLIVFDQIDKIRGFDGDRHDLVMGSIYQWARRLAKECAPVVGVCQADGTGDGIKYLTMNNVAEAKTAKQSEADWILGIGKTYNEGQEFVRHFYLSKNKLTGDPDSDPARRHGQWDVYIQPEIARYRDL